MDYKALQAKAKELGLKHVGVSAEDLEKAIAEAESSSEESPQEKPSNKDEKRDAVIYNGRHEVRTYSFEQHGEDYVKLAEQYVSHPDREDFKIRYEEVKTRIACPSCGHKFRHQ